MREKLIEYWTIKTGELLSEVFPSDEYDNRVLLRGYLLHALFILQSQEYPKEKIERENLSQRVAQYLYADGRYNEAEARFKEVFERRTQRLKKEDPVIFESMADLACTYNNRDRWNEAEELEVQVLDVRKTVLGPEHPDTLTGIWNLAYTMKDQGRHAEGLALLEVCVLLQRKSLGQAYPDTTRALSDLGLWRKALLNQSHIASDQPMP
jgi:tetratricopeptide (TPR) repeat protein